MTGGIGDEKLSGRSGISFDIINESENFPILEIFLTSSTCHPKIIFK